MQPAILVVLCEYVNTNDEWHVIPDVIQENNFQYPQSRPLNEETRGRLNARKNIVPNRLLNYY